MHGRRHALRRGLRSLVCGAGLALALPESRALAAPSARLVYVRDSGAEECPDEGAVRAAVAARLGYDPFFPFALATLFAEISRQDGVYRARVKLIDDKNVVRGARALEHAGDRCADIVDAMALSMSIAIDPHSLAGPKPPVAELGPEPVAEPDRPAPAPLPAVEEMPLPGAVTAPRVADAGPVADAGRKAEILAGGAFTGWLGAAPSASVGGLLFVGIQWSRVALFLEGRAELPASRDVRLGTVETSFVGGTVAPCLRQGIVFGCGLGTLGRLSAGAAGIARPADDASLYVLAGLRAGIALPVSASVDARLGADVLFPLTPQVIRIDGQEAYAMPRVQAGIAFGIQARIF